MNKNVAVILAAGKGKRMGANKNKQFLEMKEKPILYYTLKAFSNCNLIDEIILVAAKDEIEYCRKEIIEKYRFEKVTSIVSGGKERQHSVLNGLLAIKNCDIVIIHDGARPFVDNNIINTGIMYAEKYGAVACGVKPKDTIKVKNEYGFSINTPDRETLFAVQTPQSFKYDIILNCHKKVNKDNISVTDDTMVVEQYGYKVYLYEGNYNNIKITTTEDLIIGEKIMENLIMP
ncbi:MAG TPA: 2-C-methyl-D-erythritol 4-phosphate cytidylyltransferase [Clostridium sp.]|nr:2-C-methyl-D-erythritol 4-phosphate cytidylyltransferase [Clostridium sp.]